MEQGFHTGALGEKKQFRSRRVLCRERNELFRKSGDMLHRQWITQLRPG